MKGKKGNKAIGGVITFFVILIIGVIVAAMSIDRVDASQKGVKVQFGEVKGVIGPGIHLTGPLVDVYAYDLRIRNMEIDMTGNEAALDKEGQEVYTRVLINYRLNPNSSVVENAYSNLGRDSDLETLLNIKGKVREAVNSVVATYELKEIIANVDEVKSKVNEKIREKFSSNYFILEEIVVDNFDYAAEIKNAIRDKKVANENEAKETALANAAIAKAEGAKQVEIKQAEASAEKVKLAADAKAHEIRVQANAEADALRAKAAELTALMVENNRIDAWRAGGSQVPTTVYSTSGAEGFLMSVN